ncbi:MAG: hypothetical protein U5L45_04840 [Saprospiraceae bacterium]|nr:hypothetical protein [Saprospiraceae bacterium]
MVHFSGVARKMNHLLSFLRERSKVRNVRGTFKFPEPWLLRHNIHIIKHKC